MSRLSVVIAAYNEQSYLLEQLNAIMYQHVQPDEVVFVDDGSTDGTRRLIQDWIDTPSGQACGARLIALDQNVGCAEATNRGVAESTGDHLYIASANDIVSPGLFQAIKESYRRYPGANLVVGDIEGIHLGWSPDFDTIFPTPTYINPETLALMIGPRGIIHAAGVSISRVAWDHHGGWDASWWPYSETLTWHVTAMRYGAVYVPWAFARVRSHAGSASKTVLDREYRWPLMQKAARFVCELQEPERTRMLQSQLWGIAEWEPDMAPLLASLSRETVPR